MQAATFNKPFCTLTTIKTSLGIATQKVEQRILTGLFKDVGLSESRPKINCLQFSDSIITGLKKHLSKPDHVKATWEMILAAATQCFDPMGKMKCENTVKTPNCKSHVLTHLGNNVQASPEQCDRLHFVSSWIKAGHRLSSFHGRRSKAAVIAPYLR